MKMSFLAMPNLHNHCFYFYDIHENMLLPLLPLLHNNPIPEQVNMQGNFFKHSRTYSMSTYGDAIYWMSVNLNKQIHQHEPSPKIDLQNISLYALPNVILPNQLIPTTLRRPSAHLFSH